MHFQFVITVYLLPAPMQEPEETYSPSSFGSTITCPLHGIRDDQWQQIDKINWYLIYRSSLIVFFCLPLYPLSPSTALYIGMRIGDKNDKLPSFLHDMNSVI